MHHKAPGKYPYRFITSLYFLIAATLFLIQMPVTSYAAPGDLDLTFGNGGKLTDGLFPSGNALRDTAIQPDGKIVAVGDAGQYFAVVRYNSDSTPDPTFGGTGKVTTGFFGRDQKCLSVAIQADGKIVAAGYASFLDEYDNIWVVFVLARYNTDGSLDASFDGDGIVTTRFFPGGGVPNEVAYDVVIQPDGKIVAVGNAQGSFGLVRYNTDGSPDTSFNGGGTVTTPIGSNSFAASVAIQPDGKIVAVGASGPSFAVVRYNPNGSLDTSFDGDGIITTNMNSDEGAQDVAIEPDGKIVVAGSSRDNGGSNLYLTVARYAPNGSLDTTFNNTGIVTTPIGSISSVANSVVVQTDGKIVAAGTTSDGPEIADFALVRYNPNGSLDTTFGGSDGITTVDFGNSADNAYGMALDNLGRAVVVGRSNEWFALARFLLVPRLAPFDFDGDGRSDISVFRPSDRNWYLDQSTAGFSATQFGLSTDEITPADYDGDGKTDIAVFRPGTRTWYVLNSANGTLTEVQYGEGEDLPTPADYDGDGRADFSLFRPSNGTWYRLTAISYTVQFGASEDKPTIGDFDGDGRADIAVWRPSNRVWYRLNSSNGAFVATTFGISTDLITPADFDGDGKADIGVYRPSTGIWYWLNSSNGGFNAAQFGSAEDIPSAADFDGDGKADISVFRPSSGIWYRLNSSNGSFFAVQFGANGDRPTPAAFRF